jgi:hypothetical protein
MRIDGEPSSHKSHEPRHIPAADLSIERSVHRTHFQSTHERWRRAREGGNSQAPSECAARYCHVVEICPLLNHPEYFLKNAITSECLNEHQLCFGYKP